MVFKTVSHSHRWLITFSLNYTNLSYCTSRISNIHQLYSDRAGNRTLHHHKRVHANILILGIPNDLVTTNTLTKMRWSYRNSERNIWELKAFVSWLYPWRDPRSKHIRHQEWPRSLTARFFLRGQFILYLWLLWVTRCLQTAIHSQPCWFSHTPK